MLGQDNPFLGLFFEVNEATAGFLAYCILLLIFIVASYVMMRRTQDIAKSLIGGLHITTILSILLFYHFFYICIFFIFFIIFIFLNFNVMLL